MTFIDGEKGILSYRGYNIDELAPHATFEETTFLLWEGRIPEGDGVPAHSEHNHEAFYVLDGILEIEAEGVVHRLRRGDFLCIQPGTVHSLHNPGPGWLRSLMIVSPGRQHVRFFTTLGQPIDDLTNPPQPSGPPACGHSRYREPRADPSAWR